MGDVGGEAFRSRRSDSIGAPAPRIAALIEGRRILHLSRAEVRASGGLEWTALIDAMAGAFSALEAGQAILPKADYLRYPGRPSYDRMIALFGYLGGGFGVSGLKQICSGAGNAAAGFPRASGLLILNDPITNRPFAVMDATAISAARTAAVSGLALRLLAPPSAASIAVIGCGELAHAHLEMLATVFGAARFRLIAFDTDPARLRDFVAAARALEVACVAVESVEAAVRAGDIVLPMTTAEAPHIRRAWLRDGALYCAVSLLDAELDVYRHAALIMVDDLDQCLAEGRPLDRLRRAGELDLDVIVPIGALLAAPPTIDRTDTRPIVFNPMGTVITDLAAGLAVFAAASAARLGTTLPL